MGGYIAASFSAGVDLSQVNPASIGAGLALDPISGALRTSTTDPANLARNPNFAFGLNDWTFPGGTGGITPVTGASDARVGTTYLRLLPAGAARSVTQGGVFGATGDGFQLQVTLRCSVGTPSTTLRMRFVNTFTGAFVDGATLSVAGSQCSTWTQFELTAAMPVGYDQVLIFVFDIAGGQASATWDIGNVTLHRQIGGQQIAVNGVQDYTKIAPDAVRMNNLVVGNFANLCQDPGFESGDITMWNKDGANTVGWSVTNSTSHTGGHCAVWDPTGSTTSQFYGVRNPVKIAVKVLDQFYFECYVKADVGATNSQIDVGISWRNNSDGYISSSNFTLTPSGASGVWQVLGGLCTAPSGAAYGYVFIQVDTGSSAATGKWYVDDVFCDRIIQSSSMIAQTGIILTAHIGNAQIVDAHIVSLAATKLTAGTLAVGVVYAGTINVTQVNAGNFTSQTMTVNVNGFQADVNTFFNSDLGVWAGFKMSHPGFSDHFDLTSQGWAVYSTAGTLCTHAWAQTSTGAVNGSTASYDFGGVRCLRNGYASVWLSGYDGSVACEYVKLYNHVNGATQTVIGYLWCYNGHLYFGTGDPTAGNTWSSAGTLIV